MIQRDFPWTLNHHWDLSPLQMIYLHKHHFENFHLPLLVVFYIFLESIYFRAIQI